MEHKGTTKQSAYRAENGLCVQINFDDDVPFTVKIAHADHDGKQEIAYPVLLQAAAMVLQACAEQYRWYIPPRVCADHGPHYAELPCPGCRAAELDAGEVIR